MFPGSKVSNDNGLWPCIGIAALNVNNSSSGFGRKPLVMPEPKAQNEFAGNGLQGSVPSSPESDCEEIVDYSPVCAALEMDTREIIDIFLKSFTGLPHSKSGKKQILSTMKRVVDSLVVKHELAYKGMIARLNLEEKGEDVSFVKTVATELFSDGITNWGRIASLLTFGAIVCKHQNDRGLSKCVSLVGEEISSYLLTDQRHWLLKNKAWDGFEEFFHVPDTEGAVRNALMAIGSFATFGAALAYLIRPSVGSNEDYGNDTHRASPDPPAHCGSTCCGYLSQAVKLSGIQGLISEPSPQESVSFSVTALEKMVCMHFWTSRHANVQNNDHGMLLAFLINTVAYLNFFRVSLFFLFCFLTKCYAQMSLPGIKMIIKLMIFSKNI
uniref:MCL1 apoptosis regulator, BCL2 family member b n=1 Tax=Cyprinus carpio TaxID=7962 RepID=A0A8C2A7Q5_CYPCA